MPDPRDDLPDEKPGTGEGLNFTGEELWEAIYATFPPPLGDGEKSQGMVAQDLGMDPTTAKKLIKRWLSEGQIECVGERRMSSGKISLAYRVIR